MIKKIILFFLPWFIRRRLLNYWFNYKIDSKARIGFSWIYPQYLEMAENSKIDHFNVAINLDKIILGNNSSIGRGNWITGFSTKFKSLHFNHQNARRAELLLGESAAITKKHHFDCTNIIKVGAYATIAGYRSQFLTHSIDLYESRQDSAPIEIGEYTFVGTNVIILGNSTLPPRSVLGAKSLLNKKYSKEWTIYGGIPAKPIGEIDINSKYFSRTVGFVY